MSINFHSCLVLVMKSLLTEFVQVVFVTQNIFEFFHDLMRSPRLPFRHVAIFVAATVTWEGGGVNNEIFVNALSN